MSGMMSIVSYGLGTVIGFALFAALVIVFVRDITQKKHTVLRNYPVIGHLRYLLEKQGEYFRQYFFMSDREELPFNRATRGWVYRLAKAEAGVIGFGSTNNTNEPGSILFVNPMHTHGFVGMKREEAWPLIEELADHATQERFVYYHRWRVGDVLIWDERATMHRGAGDYRPDERRIMLRTIVYPN